VDWHPFLARLDWNADEDAGVTVVVAHLKDHANRAVAEFAARPVEQAHAALALDQAVLDHVTAWTDMFPSSEIFAIEKFAARFPIPPAT